MLWFYGGLKVQPAMVLCSSRLIVSPHSFEMLRRVVAAGSEEPAPRFGTANYP
jgi:hypothetical protein